VVRYVEDSEMDMYLRNKHKYMPPIPQAAVLRVLARDVAANETAPQRLLPRPDHARFVWEYPCPRQESRELANAQGFSPAAASSARTTSSMSSSRRRSPIRTAI